VRVLYWADHALMIGSANVDPPPFRVIVDAVDDPLRPNQFVINPAATITTTTAMTAIAAQSPRRLLDGRIVVSFSFAVAMLDSLLQLGCSSLRTMAASDSPGLPGVAGHTPDVPMDFPIPRRRLSSIPVIDGISGVNGWRTEGYIDYGAKPLVSIVHEAP